MLWWDTRKLNEPTDSLLMSTDSKNNGQVLGGSSLEYNSEAGPSKYLVGTEQGVVMMVNLKNRKQNNGITVFDQGAGKHHGPIYSIQRNPANSKCFLTIGDWTARIWNEDIRTPIMTTKYHSSYLTSGCWSPTRAGKLIAPTYPLIHSIMNPHFHCTRSISISFEHTYHLIIPLINTPTPPLSTHLQPRYQHTYSPLSTGVFFVTRMDGVVDIWDYFYRQNEVAYSHKVGDCMLSSMAVQGNYDTQYVEPLLL